MANGHPRAWHYPLGILQDEARLVVQRVNNGHVTTATLLQQAVSGVLSKEGNKAFRKVIKELLEG